MDTITEVNKTQFHYLLVKFLMKKRLLSDFISSSRRYKLSPLYRESFNDKKSVDKFSEDDDISMHLYKCIDVYIKNTIASNLYYGAIYGFFRYLPSGVPYSEWNKWKDISQEWENMYRNTLYVEN